MGGLRTPETLTYQAYTNVFGGLCSLVSTMGQSTKILLHSFNNTMYQDSAPEIISGALSSACLPLHTETILDLDWLAEE